MSWVLGRYRSLDRLNRQMRVIRRIEVPELHQGQRGTGSIWAVGVVRDEADVVGATVQHLLRQDVDHVLIADNGSVDGTLELLRDMASSDPRVHLALDREPAHHQSEKVTWLAHVAWRHGADWVLPFDADEFHFADGGTVAHFLRSLDDATVVHADFHHMVATRPTTRVTADTEFILDRTPSFPGKVVVRAHPFLEVIPGSHGASRVGPHVRGLHIAHAIYRGPEQMARKFRQGMQAGRAGRGTWPGDHWMKGERLDPAEIAEVWTRISRGLPEPRIDFLAEGPMLRVRPVGWTSWDVAGPRPSLLHEGSADDGSHE